MGCGASLQQTDFVLKPGDEATNPDSVENRQANQTQEADPPIPVTRSLSRKRQKSMVRNPSRSGILKKDPSMSNKLLEFPFPTPAVEDNGSPERLSGGSEISPNDVRNATFATTPQNSNTNGQQLHINPPST